MAKKIVFIATAFIGLIILLVIINYSGNPYEDEQVFDNTPEIEGQPTTGETDAPLTIVEFGDFMCPACYAWGEEIYPQVQKDFIDKGDAQFTYINTPFHGMPSQTAALAAESVFSKAPEDYWNFHHGLFGEQDNENHHSNWLTDEVISDMVETHTSLNADDVLSDIKNESYRAEVDHDEQMISEYGVQLTPTIFINNVMIQDPFDYDEIKETIDNELDN